MTCAAVVPTLTTLMVYSRVPPGGTADGVAVLVICKLGLLITLACTWAVAEPAALPEIMASLMTTVDVVDGVLSGVSRVKDPVLAAASDAMLPSTIVWRVPVQFPLDTALFTNAPVIGPTTAVIVTVGEPAAAVTWQGRMSLTVTVPMALAERLLYDTR